MNDGRNNRGQIDAQSWEARVIPVLFAPPFARAYLADMSRGDAKAAPDLVAGARGGAHSSHRVPRQLRARATPRVGRVIDGLHMVGVDARALPAQMVKLLVARYGAVQSFIHLTMSERPAVPSRDADHTVATTVTLALPYPTRGFVSAILHAVGGRLLSQVMPHEVEKGLAFNAARRWSGATRDGRFPTTATVAVAVRDSVVHREAPCMTGRSCRGNTAIATQRA